MWRKVTEAWPSLLSRARDSLLIFLGLWFSELYIRKHLPLWLYWPLALVALSAQTFVAKWPFAVQGCYKVIFKGEIAVRIVDKLSGKLDSKCEC